MRVLPILALVLCYGAPLAAADPAAGQVKAYTCTGCHGIRHYNNVYPVYKVPKIGGQNEAYILAALEAYRDGSRRHPTMGVQAESFNQNDLADIAAWLSDMGRAHDGEKTGAAGDPAAGQALAATCQACHGPTGNESLDPSYPKLAGQYPDYLAKALGDYRSGARANPVMAGFAAALTDQQIADLAAWFASQPGDLSDLSTAP